MKHNKSFITNRERFYIITKFIITAISTLLSFLIPIIIKNLIDNKGTGLERNQLIGYITIYVSVYLMQMLLKAVMTKQKYNLLKSLQKKIFRKIILLPTKKIGDTTSGELIEVMDKDVKNVCDYYFEAYPNVVISIFNFIGSVFIIFYLDVIITIAIIIGLLIIAAVIIPLYIYTAKFSEIEYENHKDFISFLNNIIKCLPLIKASGTENVETELANEHFDKAYRNTLKSTTIDRFISPLIGGVLLITIGGVVVFISFRISLGLITIGKLTAYILFALKGIVPLIAIIFQSKEVIIARKSIKRIRRLLGYSEENLSTGKSLTSIDTISFENVSFQYTEKVILKEICLSVSKGEYIAIVGSSGAGKTTLISLIERFYTPSEGQIVINGKTYENYSIESLRRHISYVSQEYIIINKTIRDNLNYGLKTHFSDDEMIGKLKEVPCFDFIFELENKLDYVVAENGMNLSGGQKQRLAIARAYLRNSDVWLLDEVTANLDAHSEKDIAALLSNIKKDKIIISIAHRLSSIINSDRIIVIENGKITGIGAHQDLLKTHAYYRNLVENQFINKE